MKAFEAQFDYDLLTITREQLRVLLSTAKDEIAKYNRCCRKEKEICRLIEEVLDGCGIGCFTFIGCFLATAFSAIATCEILGYCPGLVLVFFVTALLSILVFRKWRDNEAKKKEMYKAQLQDLQKEKEKAINEFKATLFIPDDYCYEYALATMLKFIDNKRACNWKEASDLYETYLHRKTMEENAQQTLEQSMLQTELARQTRSAAYWTAVGTWATAAGIWLKENKS